MAELPDDVVAALARGLGAYVRTTTVADLPGGLKRLKRFAGTDKGLIPHRHALLAELEDEPTRALIAQWLDDKPPLSKSDIEALRLAAVRPEGWTAELLKTSRGPRQATAPDAGLKENLEREREKTRQARDEARRAKEEARTQMAAARAQISQLQTEVENLRTLLDSTQRERDTARRELDKAGTESERVLRRTQRDLSKAQAESDELRRVLREEKRSASASRRQSAPPTRRRPARAPVASETSPETPRGPRVPLPAPLGRLADDPETLSAWLDAPDVRLLVDGYNVAKAEGGYGDLELASQRERVIDGVARLARKKKVGATIVFDGADVTPTNVRRSARPATVEYSAAGETADDRLITLLGTLPPTPVVVVTNDRELQERARSLGATIAVSSQLLALIR